MARAAAAVERNIEDVGLDTMLEAGVGSEQ
jgi:hypothetical protein